MAMEGGELIARYAAGERDFAGVDLTGANLQDVFLDGINLEGAILDGANLCFSTFIGANFKNASMKEIIAQETAFVDAIFENANLTNAVIVDCSINGADFTELSLKDLILTVSTKKLFGLMGKLLAFKVRFGVLCFRCVTKSANTPYKFYIGESPRAESRG